MDHHAYYIEGDTSLLEALVSDIRAREGIDSNNPNFVTQIFEKFGIDEARQLQNLAQLKNTAGSAVFVIALSSITTEAQQALLKLFEEPQQGSTFILLVPHGALLPMVRSRFLPYPYDIERPLQLSTEAKKFLKAPAKERTAVVAELLDDDEGVKERVRGFLSGLEAELHSKIDNKKARDGLADIAKVRSYVGDRSPALKMLLEHLALALPQI